MRCQLAFGGAALGWVAGMVSVWFLEIMFRGTENKITLSLATCYMTFFAAESLLKVN